MTKIATTRVWAPNSGTAVVVVDVLVKVVDVLVEVVDVTAATEERNSTTRLLAGSDSHRLPEGSKAIHPPSWQQPRVPCPSASEALIPLVNGGVNLRILLFIVASPTHKFPV